VEWSELQDCCGLVFVSCCCSKLVAEARNPEEGGGPPLEAVTRQQPVKVQQIENT
jgi:hypothetical protein